MKDTFHELCDGATFIVLLFGLHIYAFQCLCHACKHADIDGFQFPKVISTLSS
jgi:hypothetical protein